MFGQNSGYQSSLLSSSTISNSAASNDSVRHSELRTRSQSPEAEYRLHIGGIVDRATKSDLKCLFEKFGNLKEVWLTNCSPKFGFAVYKTEESAVEALKATNRKFFCGAKIRVTIAKPRKHGRTGRRFWESRCFNCGLNGHLYRYCPEMMPQMTNSFRPTRTQDKQGNAQHVTKFQDVVKDLTKL